MIIDLLFKELSRDEDVKFVKYSDTKGIPTTGLGHNLVTSPLPAGWTFPLTVAQVMQLFNHDIAVIFAGLDLHLPWWRSLSEVRQRVIANMAFNMGVDGLLGFKETLALVHSGNYVGARFQMLNSDWAKQVKDRAQHLADAMANDVMLEPANA